MSQPAEAWRGVAAEDNDDISASLSTLLRRRGRRLLQDLLRPHRRSVLAILVLILIANLGALAGPWLVGIGVDLVPQLTSSHDLAPMVAIIAAFAVAVLTQAVATRAFIAAMGRLGGTVVLELRRRLFAHFQRLPVAFHERYTSGRVISRQVSDIDSISDLFEEGLDSLVFAVFSLLLVGVGMLLLDWQLALVVLAGFAPLIWLTAWFRRESALAYRRTRDTIALVIVQFVETFGGIQAVQAFRREQRNEEIFGELNERYAAASLRSSRLIAIYSPGITLVGNLAIGAVLLYGGLRVIDGDMKVGVLVTFLLYLQRFFDPLQDLSQFYNTFQSAAAALEKISGVLDEEPQVAEPAEPAALPPLPSGSGGRAVTFEAVRFGYRRTTVLPGLDLSIPAGQTAALVGATGAGKTTIARLLARFYDPVQGRILLDGVDLRQLSEQSLRAGIIMITQENFLFSGTIADNIELGKPGTSRARPAGGGRGHRGRRVHRRAAGRLRLAGRQARRPAVGRPAAAHLLRARLPRRPGGAGTRRGHLAARHPERAARAGGPAHHPDRAHRADHRPPAVHGRNRRPGAGHRRRPYRGGRPARAAAHPGRRVRRPARQLARQPRLIRRQPRGTFAGRERAMRSCSRRSDGG